MANSSDLKLAALHWLRFSRQLSYIATECGHWSADVIGCDGKDLVEIEVKVSMADLRAEFRNKVEKHAYYPDPVGKIKADNLTDRYKKTTDMTKCWYPTQFYILVPKELAQEALEFVNGKCPKYGIMYYNQIYAGPDANCIHVIKTARVLRPKGVAEPVRDKVAKRMASELIGLRDRIRLFQNEPK